MLRKLMSANFVNMLLIKSFTTPFFYSDLYKLEIFSFQIKLKKFILFELEAIKKSIYKMYLYMTTREEN